jgi:pilus assembly protein CpaF
MALFRKNSDKTPNSRDDRSKETNTPLPFTAPPIQPIGVMNGNGSAATNGNYNGSHNGNGHSSGNANGNGNASVAPSANYTPPPEFRQVREEVQQFLVNEVKSVADVGGPAKLRQLVEPVFNRAVESANLIVSRVERARLMDMILADILGFGPIQPLLDRDDITEIMINGPKQIYIEHEGKLELTDIKFIDDNHVMQIIERIVAPIGRRIDEASPMVDARLPDGSRVNAVIPPLSLVGPCVTIRKFRKDPYKIEDLVRFKSLTANVAEFIQACVHARLNIIVSGGTGSGKTTMLNVVSNFIPEDERIATVEDAAELQLQQPHVVRLEKRPPNMEGKGGVGIRELVVNCLRMRPDRIVVGEVRSGEALDMLQAMNTGHNGSLTTVHSNGARDTLNRIETMVLMAGMELPLRAIRQQMASAVDLIIHLERMRDGTRRVVQVAEVLGMEGEMILMQDIFMFQHAGMDDDGKLLGELRATGLRPRCNDRIEEAGITLPPYIFGSDPKNPWK